ncbi:capsular exopolysaccharide family [Xylanimonas cellulosilytica DSM 15894]|uniref:non-specific protein-tyrosine kinase n=1 Tax=Xylanimonas cellulosilytica (strain DSM 15894 / JCM 12276 / CECT 5975 / KCTC 9989 / LMG 20990 / NBRC 107835 / XIL07) TaxID=446471 RepID=D1BYJ5_XYLCX|nr:polysaccharide biosynthesis tyrosine autokinase [Xylanimonas cellulosilytica]ACZ31867.1 capsular exopolysaccharide family [Xylanimonas cellulosilytica DSM 15894]
MELADYLSLLRKRWLSITVLTVLGLVAGLAASVLATPVFTARSQVFVSVRGSDTTSDLLQGSNFTVRQVRSYVQLVQTPRVLQPVIEELGLTDTPSQLAERVRAESPLDTVLINVTADDESAQFAADIANSVARSLSAVVQELETPQGAAESPVEISTVRSAVAPTSPSSPNTTMNLALGLLVGLALGVGVAVLREVLNTKMRDVADVEAVTEASVLGAIPFEPDAADSPLIVQESPHSLRSEAFRRLRTNLQFLEFDRNQRAIVTTSALPGEGKTTTTINLAITLADAGQRVALVDADLRRPSIAKYMGLEGSVGLTTVLIGRARLDDVAQPWGNGNLDVITSGQVPPNPSELLGSRNMDELLDELHAKYDVVLIDTSPLLPVTDGAILARLVGGAVVVVGAGTVHRQQVDGALQALDSVAARVLGVVVNRAPTKGSGTYAYSYAYGYASEQADSPEKPRAKRAPRTDVAPAAAGPAHAGDPRRKRELQSVAAAAGADAMRFPPVNSSAQPVGTSASGEGKPRA